MIKLVILALLTLFFFLLTYISAPGEFSNIDLIIITTLAVLTLSFQGIILNNLRNKNYIKNFVFSIFGIVNIYVVNIALNISFIDLTLLFKLSILAGAGFTLFTMANIVQDTKWGGTILLFIGLIGCKSIILSNYYSTSFTNKSSPELELVTDNLQMVSFQTKPNIYIVSFDSLIPKELLKKNLSISDTPYHRVLEANFKIFKNMFADATPTKESLNALLALDHDYFLRLRAEGKNDHLKFYDGTLASPLFQIFSKNGYSTNTVYNSNYFGKVKGKYVDNYWINSKLSACEFIDRDTATYVFFGYCALNHTNTFKIIMESLGLSETPDAVDFLLKTFNYGLQQDKPQISLSYIYSPGHTKKKYRSGNQRDFKQYRRQYIKNSKITAQQIFRIVNFLKKHDPNSILVIFGDHGPWLSRTILLDEQPEFYIQDRFGVFGGIHPKTKCHKWFKNTGKEFFFTPTKLAIGIINCISNANNVKQKHKLLHPIIRGRKTAKGNKRKNPIYGSYQYSDFLYE